MVNVHHEDISVLMMQHINAEMDGRLSLAIEIFQNKYHKHFLHQLVSSQLDMDRLDYLSRDSFFTGVHEGIIGYDRIIKMLNVVNNQLVVEEKGVYSIERFSHFTTTHVLAGLSSSSCVRCRADDCPFCWSVPKKLVQQGVHLQASYNLSYFLERDVDKETLNQRDILYRFAELDDTDLYETMKIWKHHDDVVFIIFE